MREMLEEKLARFEELEQQMSDPEVLSDSNRMASVAPEHGGLNGLVNKYKNLLKTSERIAEARELMEGPDREFRELAEMELPELQAKQEKIWNDLLEMTIGGEDAAGLDA